MQKKFPIMLLGLCLIFGLAGCTKDKRTDNPESNNISIRDDAAAEDQLSEENAADESYAEKASQPELNEQQKEDLQEMNESLGNFTPIEIDESSGEDIILEEGEEEAGG